jgi:hypothetical protein
VSDLGPPPPPPPSAYVPPAGMYAPPPPPPQGMYAPPPPPPVGWTPPNASYEPVRSSRSPVRAVFRLLGILVLVVGCGASVVVFVLAFVQTSRDIDAFARGPLPEAKLDLEPGAYTIFLEGNGLTDEDSNENCRRCDEARASRVTITGPDGPVPVGEYGGTTTYDFGHEGVAIGTVSIDEAASYEVRVQASLGSEVAIGHYGIADIFKYVGIGMGGLFVSIFLGIAFLRIGRRT